MEGGRKCGFCRLGKDGNGQRSGFFLCRNFCCFLLRNLFLFFMNLLQQLRRQETFRKSNQFRKIQIGQQVLVHIRKVTALYRTDRNTADRSPHHAIHKVKVDLCLQFLIGHGAVSNADLSQIREVCIHAVFLLAKRIDSFFCLSHGFGFFCRLCFLLRYLLRFCVFLLFVLFLYHRIRMPCVKEPAQVGFADMIRESAHRQSLAVCKTARSQGQPQRLCRCFGVLAEKLVKVADTDYSEVIRVLGFDLSVGA